MSVLTSGISEQDAIDKVVQKFNYDVKKFPVHGPDNTPTGYFGLFDKDFNVIGTRSVTDDYYVHDCGDIVELATAAIRAFNGVMDVQCSFNNGHQVIIEPPRDVRHSIFGTKDNIFGRVIIKAPYVSGCVDASVGFWRDMCRNMAEMKQVHGVNMKIRHTESLIGKMADLKAQFSDLASGWDNLADAVDSMEANEVLLSDYLDSIYGETTDDMKPSQIKRHKSRTEAIVKRLLSEHSRAGRQAITSVDNLKVTGWQAFNAVQGHQQHDSIRRGAPSPTERIWKSFSDPKIRKAEELALAAA